MASGADIIQDDQTVFCDSGSECGKTGMRFAVWTGAKDLYSQLL